jgi:hypothetical protein
MCVQFTSPCSLDQWIHCFFISPRSLQLVNSLKIQWNHLVYKDTFCGNALWVKVGSLYFKHNYQHAHNNQIYTTFKCPITNIIIFKILQNKKMKFVLFVIVYHLLPKGATMSYFDGWRGIWSIFMVKYVLKKHWSDSTWCGITKSIQMKCYDDLWRLVEIWTQKWS